MFYQRDYDREKETSKVESGLFYRSGQDMLPSGSAFPRVAVVLVQIWRSQSTSGRSDTDLMSGTIAHRAWPRPFHACGPSWRCSII